MTVEEATRRLARQGAFSVALAKVRRVMADDISSAYWDAVTQGPTVQLRRSVGASKISLAQRLLGPDARVEATGLVSESEAGDQAAALSGLIRSTYAGIRTLSVSLEKGANRLNVVATRDISHAVAAWPGVATSQGFGTPLPVSVHVSALES